MYCCLCWRKPNVIASACCCEMDLPALCTPPGTTQKPCPAKKWGLCLLQRNRPGRSQPHELSSGPPGSPPPGPPRERNTTWPDPKMLSEQLGSEPVGGVHLGAHTGAGFTHTGAGFAHTGAGFTHAGGVW